MSARRRSRRAPAARGGRRAWLAWALGLLALGALVWGLSSRERPAPPLDHIDLESRERLDAVLREAERAERAR